MLSATGILRRISFPSFASTCECFRFI